MRKAQILFLFSCFFATMFLQSCEEEIPGTQMVWSDEFNYEGKPDSTKWGYDLGDGCPNLCGWGNNELEYYTDRLENARVENGYLIIEARKENYGTREYTSARLVSKNKGDWKYGRVEARAILPAGKGTWAAIWMLPTDWAYGGWPESGEIDIMEHVGYASDTVYSTVHTKAFNHMHGTQVGDKIYLPDAEQEFHVYAVEWTEEKLDFFVDDQKYFSFKNQDQSFAEFPFDQKFHLIMNIAVGGNWGAKHGVDAGAYPQKMVIDYVRVYDLNGQMEDRTLSKR